MKSLNSSNQTEYRYQEYAPLLSSLIAAVFWLSTAGVNVIQSAVSLVAIILLGQFGWLILHPLVREAKAQQVRDTWSVRLGPLLGVGLLTLFVLRMVSSQPIFMLLLASVLVVSALSFAKTFTSLTVRDSIIQTISSSPDWLWQIPASIALMGFMLLADWWWALPICIAALISSALIVNGSTGASMFGLKQGVCLILLTIGTITSMNLRAKLWWITYNNDDDPWFHLIAHGLVQWGPFVRADVDAHAGTSASAYHLLAYFFGGVVDSLWPSPPLFVVNRVLPVLIAVIALNSLHAFMYAIRDITAEPQFPEKNSFWALAAFCSAVMISGAPSDFLGAALLIGFIAIAPMIVAEMSFLRFLTLTFFVTVSTAFAKGPYMYAIVIVIITLTLATRRPRHFLIAPGVSGCAVLVFFSQSNVATSIGFGFFPLASLGEHSFASGLAGRLLAIAFVLMPLAIGIISAIALNLVVRTPTVSAQVSWSLLVVMFCALASRLFLAADARTHSYFFEPGLIAGGLMVMLAFRESRENRLQQVPSIIVIAIAIVMLWQFVIPEVVPSLNSGSIAAKSLRMLREATVVNLLLLGLVILVYLGHIIRRNRPRANSPIRVLLALPLLPPALLAATNVPSMFSEIEQRHRKTQSGEEDLWRERVIGSSEAREVARVLGELNINDELVAYTSCGNDLKRGCEPPLVFVAYSGSRFLAAYSDLKAEWGLANLAADQDYELTLSLLKIPASEAINNLRLRNVALLVVDLRRATPPWISSALASGTTMLYSNESFAIIALSPPSEP